MGWNSFCFWFASESLQGIEIVLRSYFSSFEFDQQKAINSSKTGGKLKKRRFPKAGTRVNFLEICKLFGLEPSKTSVKTASAYAAKKGIKFH
jgi:hypothetical protein